MSETSINDRAFPILSVDDLAATVAFYARLGFAPTYAFPAEGEAAFVIVERTGSVIGIAARKGGDGDGFAYWVYVDDVDATFDSLVAAGSAVVAVPRAEPWGERVASLRDPAGNVVHLGAPI